MRKLLQVALFAAALLLPAGASLAQPTVGPVTNYDARLVDNSCSQSAIGLFHIECYVPAGGSPSTAISGSGSTAVYPFDAAWNAAAAYVLAGSGAATLVVPPGGWSGCNNAQGYVIPQAVGTNGGLSIIGAGEGSPYVSLLCTINRTGYPSGAATGTGIALSQAMFWMPVQTSARQTNMTWRDMNFYANGGATLVADLEGLVVQSTFENLVFTGAKGDGTTTSAEVRIGNSSNGGAYLGKSWMFQSAWRNIYIGTSGTPGAGATFGTVTESGGVPTVPVTAGGSGYSANTVVYLTGCPASASYNAVRLTTTLSGGAITAVNDPGSAPFYNCAFYSVGPGYGIIYAHAYDPVYQITTSLLLDNATDNSFYDLQVTVGTIAALNIDYAGSGSNQFYHLHPCCYGIPIGVLDVANNNAYYGTEIDSTGLWGFEFYNSASPLVVGTQWLWNATNGSVSVNYAGAQEYLLGTSAVTPKIYGDLCGGTGLNQTYGEFFQINYNFGSSGNNPPFGGNQVFVDDMACDGTNAILNSLPGTTTLGATTTGALTPASVASVAGVSGTTGTFTGALSGALLKTTTNCSSAASPAACAAAATGSVVVAAGATTVVVNDTAVTAGSIIQITDDSSQGTKLGVTCNTTPPSALSVSARTAGASFTITSTAPVTNPLCLNFEIIN